MFYKRTSFIYFISVLLLPVAIESALFKCQEEGRFSIFSDCGSYIECVRKNVTGILEARKGSCGKGGFHPKEKRCVSLKKLKGCNQRRARLDLKRHDLSHLCSGGSDFVCADCNTLVHCLDGVAFAQSCSPGDLCQVKETFGGAVCYPEWLPKCSCERSNIFRKDPYDKRTFYFCDNYALPTFYKCSEEMIFDLNIEQCVNEYGLPPCTKIGVFADNDDCRNYYTCIQSERGWVQKLFTCPGLTMYSEVNSKCEDPCKWYKGVFECAEEGRFRDKTNCQAFYECISTDEGFRKTKRLCPSGFSWEQTGTSNTGNCIRKEDSQCDALTATSCDVPPDWCEFDVGAPPPNPDFEDQTVDYDYVDYASLKKPTDMDTILDLKRNENADSSNMKINNTQEMKEPPFPALSFTTSLSDTKKGDLKTTDDSDTEISEFIFNNKDMENYKFKINANKFFLLRGNNKNADDSILGVVKSKPHDIKIQGAAEVNTRENDKNVNNENEEVKLDNNNKYSTLGVSDKGESLQHSGLFIPIVIRNKGQHTDNQGDNGNPETIITLETQFIENKEEESENKDNVEITNNDNEYQKETSSEKNTPFPVIDESTTAVSDALDTHENIYDEISEISHTDDKSDIVYDSEGTETTEIAEVGGNTGNVHDTSNATLPVSDSEGDVKGAEYLHGHGYVDSTTSEDSGDSFTLFPNIFSAYEESLNFESSEEPDESSSFLDSHNSTTKMDITTADYQDPDNMTEIFDDAFVVSTTERNLNDFGHDDSVDTTLSNDLQTNSDYDYYILNSTAIYESSRNTTSNDSTNATTEDLLSSDYDSASDNQSSSFNQTDESSDDSVTGQSTNGDAGHATALDHDRSFEEEPYIFTLGDEVPNLNRILF